MDNFSFLTLVDHNPINHRALKYLLYSAETHAIKNDIHILYPNEVKKPDLQHSKFSNSVYFHPIDFNISDKDPYFVKLMLHSYMKSLSCLNSNYFYLDPDHVFIKPINNALTQVPHSSLITSSESHPLNILYSNKINQMFNLPGITRHYNTSIIYGSYRNWLKSMREWHKTYSLIIDIEFRIREELSFSISSNKNGVALIEASNLLQGNFHTSSQKPILFHYGGDYKEAKFLKNTIVSTDFVGALKCAPNVCCSERIEMVEYILRFMLEVNRD